MIPLSIRNQSIPVHSPLMARRATAAATTTTTKTTKTTTTTTTEKVNKFVSIDDQHIFYATTSHDCVPGIAVVRTRSFLAEVCAKSARIRTRVARCLTLFLEAIKSCHRRFTGKNLKWNCDKMNGHSLRKMLRRPRFDRLTDGRLPLNLVW